MLIKSDLDIYQKERDNKRQMQKLSYERKIQIAESAVAFYSHYRYNVVQLKSCYQTVLQFIEQIDDEGNIPGFNMSLLFEHTQHISEVIKLMFGQAYKDVLSMNLYFDFSGSQYFKPENLLKMNTAVGKVKAIDTDIEFWNNQADIAYDAGNDELGDGYIKQGIELLPGYGESLKIVVELLDLDSKGAEELVATVKAQTLIY